MGKIKFSSLAETAKHVRYGDDDRQNKYGYTRRMSVINDLVNDEKPLEDADFVPNEYDKAYYEHCKWEYDLVNRGSDKKKRLACYYNE